MKKKQSATGLFFSMFLRAVVVILVVVIVCLGFALVRSLIHGKSLKKAEADTTVQTEIQTDELLTAEKTEATTEVIPADYGIKIAVLNGTDTGGLAGAWKAKLEEMGYTAVDAGNYKGVTTNSKLYFSQDKKGEELAALFPGATIETEMMKEEETDVVISTHDVLIVIGTNDDIVSKQ